MSSQWSSQPRAVIFDDGKLHVLAIRYEELFRLPSISAFDVGDLTLCAARTIRNAADLDVFVLDWIEEAEDPPICVARTVDSQRPITPPYVWIDLSHSLTLQSRDASILALAIERQAENDDAIQRPFCRFKTLDELKRWYMPALGIYQPRLEHWQSGPDSTLIRIDVEDNTVWLKAVGAEYNTEPSISQALARMIPNDVPAVLTVHERWNAMLLEGVDGPTLNNVQVQSAWIATAERLAELQIMFVSSEDPLLHAGCADWRLPNLLNAIPSFFEAMGPVMQAQTSSRQPRLNHDDLANLSSLASGLCESMRALNIPDTLTHANFSPHNVIWHDDRPVFLDWAFGIVGFPFVSEEYFRHRMEREHPEFAAWSRTLQAAYYLPWSRVIDRTTIEFGRSLAPSVAPLLAAVNLHAQDREAWRHNSVRATVLRSLVRRFAREVWASASLTSARSVVQHA